jgi:hypothetical protein
MLRLPKKAGGNDKFTGGTESCRQIGCACSFPTCSNKPIRSMKKTENTTRNSVTGNAPIGAEKLITG